ncbi:multiple epidermal growth factor-like domains protein 10 [Pomacea canaliculata]|uniref:multiple epidermal growth factor-like domains protein 10 n=1 Tax=Pomacea canaliculata TaxID=400727 RepID=UPI000D72974C|nr:multiple epidermal growth factor-like domains protein 10 [Pomacea canaliculata]
MCADLCSQISACHVFYFRSDTGHCFLSPTLGKGNSTTSTPLTHVYFDGVTCPLNSTFQPLGFISCIKLNTTKVNITIARQACIDDGASFVSMKTKEKMELLVNVVYRNTTQGAEKLLNEACTNGDTCVDISGNSLQLTCDVLVKRCLIKAGYACGETEDLCFTGAYCDTLKKCKCAEDYTEDDGDCERKGHIKPMKVIAGPDEGQPGDDCDKGCIDNAACSDELCSCNAGFRLDENGVCVAVADHTVGAECEPDEAKPEGDCDDQNAVCSTTAGEDRCDCKDGYVGVVGWGCNVMPNKLGGRCKKDTAASKDTCEGDGVCSATSDGVCQCPQGYEGTEGKTVCNVKPNKLGGSCTTNTAASRGSCEGHGLCSATTDGVCQCPPGYEGKNGDTVCNIKPNKLGGSCTTDTEASQGSCEGDGVCSATTDGVCQCPQGYEGTEGDTVCKVSFNAPCTSGEECADDFAVCDLRTSKCLIKADSSCSGSNTEKCVSNATCSESSRCACRSGYTATTAGLCGVALGFSCISDDDCAHSTSLCDATTSKCLIKAGESCSAPNTNNCVSNATCTEDDNTCLCDTNFHASNNGLCILQDEKGRAPRESSLSPLLTWFIGLCLALYVV